MPYLDESGLAHYDPKLKEWISAQPVKTLPSSLYPWAQTAKAGAVTCWPVGGTELKPTVDFLFTETGPASGDKGPENPSTITGVSSVKVTRCGKNLCPTTVGYKNYNDITVTANVDGSLTLNGTARAGTLFYAEVYHEFHPTVDRGLILKRGADYTASMIGGSDVYFYLHQTRSTTSDGGYGSSVISITTGEHSTTTIPSNITGFIFKVVVPAGITVNNATVKIQLEEGDTATSFEPYSGTDYTIQLGNTYYGGEIDLATGLMTVTHTSMTVDGNLSYTSSAFYEGTDYYRMGFYPAVQRPITGTIPVSDTACDILPVMPAGSTIDTDCFYFPSNSFVIRIYMTKATLGLGDGVSYSTVVNAYNSYFTAHPAQLVYPVKTPTTVSLTPTQIFSLAQVDKYTPRLNTIYTDASAVQVGYVKSPIREEQELTQAIVSQGGNV